MDCIQCGGLLTGRQKKYCSSVCGKKADRASWILKIYGLTMDQWDDIWAEQDGRCGLCRRTPRANETFHLDHEHTEKGAGRCRGILCPYCNVRLVGRLKSHERAQQLADYLRDPPAVRAVGEVIAPGRPPKKRQPRKRPR